MPATPPTSATNSRRTAAPATGGRATPVLVPQEALAGQPDIPLNRAVTTVGSSETCRLVLQSRTISRHHAVFLVDGGTVFVADLASRTGVLVNGKPVREAELNAGDRVQVGKFVFRFRSADGPAPDAGPVAPAASAVVTGLLAIPLHGRIALVGRRETSDVALVGDNAVSAAHAALFHAGGQWYVRDLGSRTGTSVNGQAIIQQAIHFGDRIGVGAATIQFESAVAVPGHAAVDASHPLASTAAAEAPAPLPTELAPLPLGTEDVADVSSTEPPSMPFGLVAAADHPFAAVLTAAETTGPVPLADDPALGAAEGIATLDPDVIPLTDAFGHPLPEIDGPAENPPLPQPRSWDAVDVNDPPMPSTPVAEQPAVPPAPQPKSWDDLHGLTAPADEPPSGHGVAALVPPAQIDLAEPTPSPEPVPVDGGEIDPSTESLAGLGVSDAAVPADGFIGGADLAELVASLPDHEPLSLEPSRHESPAAFDAGSDLAEPFTAEPPVEPSPQAEGPSVDTAVHEDAAPASWEDPVAAQPTVVQQPTVGQLPAAEAVEEVVGPTEPTPDSALAWEAEIAAEGEPAPAPVVAEALSDSQFGRQVDEFVAADTTGPLVESDVATGPAQESEPGGSAAGSSVESAEPAAEPLGSDGAHLDATPEPPTAVAGVPATPRVTFVPPANLLEDVSDFVFVPGDATPDADVIFWGDPDLDAVAEATVAGAADFVAPVAVGPSRAVEPPVEPDPAGSVDAPVPDVVDGPVDDVPTAADEGAPYAAEPGTAASSADAAAVVTEGEGRPADELAVVDTVASVEAAVPDVARPVEAGDLAAVPPEPVAELLNPIDLPDDAAVETTGVAEPFDAEPFDAEPFDAEPFDAASFDAAPAVGFAEVAGAHERADGSAYDDAALPVSAEDSLTAGPFTAEPSLDLEHLSASDAWGADDVTGDPADALPAGDGDGVAAEAVEPVTMPPVPVEEPDPALAISAVEPAGVTPMAFDDLLADAPTAAGLPPLALPAALATGLASGWLPERQGNLPADSFVSDVDGDDPLSMAVAPSDDPVGFELDADGPDEAAAADWDDLDLLDAAEPDAADRHLNTAVAIDDFPAADAGDGGAIGFTADEATAGPAYDLAAEVPPTIGDFGAVVNVPEGLVAGLSSTEALAPVTDFAAVGGGAEVESFAAVTDAALTEPPPQLSVEPTVEAAGESVATADDLAFLDFEASDKPSGFLSDDPAVEPPISDVMIGEPTPDGGFATMADEAVPADLPELVATVTEPTVDVAPPVEDPPLRLLASVTIPPPAEQPPARPPMSGPSLFGFNFEGGSFLGGMPLPLNGAAAPSPLPPGGIVFDAPTPGGTASGDNLDDALAESPAESLAESPDDGGIARVRPPAPPAPAGLIGLVAGSVELPVVRPVAPVGLTNGASGGRTLPPPPTPPPGFADVGNGRARSGDVFSQAAGPIGVVEAFGTRPGRTEQYQIPEVDRSAPPGTALAMARGDVVPALPPPGQRLPNAERLIPADLPKRKKVRWLLAALVGLPIGWSAMTYTCVSKSATVVGTLRFDGLDAQGESARRLFRGDQVARLCSDDVRSTAHARLVNAGKPTGPTDDAGAMGRALQDDLKFIWDPKRPNELSVTYKTSDGDAGKAQVEALLSALRAKDEPLGDARGAAAQQLATANAAYAAAKATDDQLKADRREQVRLAEDKPDKATVDALDRTLDAANQKVAAVQAERSATEAVLAGWQKQDPTKPVDPALDPEASNLRRQLAQSQAQIEKAKKLAEMSGTAVGTGDDDPIMAQFKQKAEALQAKLDGRLKELALDSSTPPEDRTRQRETAIEQLGVKVAALRKAESDAVAEASTALTAATDAHAKVDAARLADGKAQDLATRQMDADLALKQAADDQGERQHALEATVVVTGSASTNPDVSIPGGESDPRLMTALVGSLVIAGIIVAWLLAVAGTGDELEGHAAGADRQVDQDEVVQPDERHEPVGV